MKNLIQWPNTIVAFIILWIKDMITKEQYIEIIEQFENYIKKYGEIFEKPMSKDFQDGMVRVIDLIKPLVKKD